MAFLLRFAAVLIAKSYWFPPPRPGLASAHWEFGYEMGRIAHSIALGHGFGSPFHGWTGPTAWQPPLYPYLLAGIFRLFGVYSPASGLVALALNCIAAGLSTLLIYRIADHIGGKKVALWSAWIWAVLPSMMDYAVFWAWETEITILLLLIAIWLTLTLPDENSSAAWLKLGAVWGLIALINTTLISMMPFMLAWAWWQSRSSRRTWHAAAAVALVVVMITPWIIRDRVVMGKWMFMRDNLWAEVSFGNDANSRRGWLTWRYPGSDPAEFRHYAEAGELNYLAGRKRLVFDTFHRDPGFFARTTLQHVVVFWVGPYPFFNDDLTPADVIDQHALEICLTTLAWAGLLLLLLDRPGRKLGLLLLPALLV
ncbi:MAG: glycosyltransferase family 39 protein, partial [Terriglobales bacterium]